MSSFKSCLDFAVVVLAVAFFARLGLSSSEHDFRPSACRLLNEKFTSSNLWTNYPIVYEPINRGRLTISTGQSTLPSSEFQCYSYNDPKQNKTSLNNDIIMDFANFANKLDWTFYDLNKGAVYHGITVNHCQDVKYKISIKNRQADLYTECNTVDKVERLASGSQNEPILLTTCQECSQTLISIINSQIKELIRLKLEDQIMDNLYWQISQLISNQHFSGPISVKQDLD